MENHRILIVEDDEAIAGAVSRIIESWGLTPRCVRDFRDVLREFTDFDPHLVLMDITLPFFNGYHWCSEIRKISAVPIIFVSSASENMNIVMAVDMGGDDFIAKPFDPVVVKKSRHEKYLFLICFFKSRHEEYFCRSCFFKSGHGQ